MKKLQNLLVSTRTMAILLFLYVLAMAIATFIENDYGTPAAKALVYEAKWFECVMLLLILNFIGNISRYRLWRKEKLSILIFHLAFIIIFIGGAITRYISYEGTMYIKEGENSNEIITDKNFFKIQIEEKGDRLYYQDIPYLMSPLSYNFKAIYDFHGKKISVKAVDYIPRMKDSLIVGSIGNKYLHLVVNQDKGRRDFYIKNGEIKNIGGLLFSYGRSIDGAVHIKEERGKLYIKSPETASFMKMATREITQVIGDKYYPLSLRSLYTIKSLQFVIPEGLKTGELLQFEGDKKKDEHLPDLLKINVKTSNTQYNVDIPVEKGNPNLAKQIKIDDMDIMLGFGPKVYKTPFHLKLDRFVMETYPGSQSPSSYESHVQIIDEGKKIPYKIYMNNILDYKGYRFFQSSFTPDLKGTILSVNHDYWGTLFTYTGYTFLFLGMFFSLFWRGTRFREINKSLKNISKKSLLLIIVLLSLFFHAQSENIRPKSTNLTADDWVKKINIQKKHAEYLGSLLVQTYDGRIAPLNTQALNILRKLTKREKFQHLNANQWFLAVSVDPMFWSQVNIIKVGNKGGSLLLKKTNATDDGFTSLTKLFPADVSGNPKFVLEEDFKTAFRKKATEQTQYDKEVIAINDRIQVMNGLLSWQYLRVVPIKNHSNSEWTSVMDSGFNKVEVGQDILGPYLGSVLMATQNNNWEKANRELKKLKEYQYKWGKNVIPDENKIKAEIFMNKANIFYYLLILYAFVGGVLLIVSFVQLFNPKKIIPIIIKIIVAFGGIGYFLHLLGLILRWYISGHAPWSNGYEAIIFISWIGITIGLVLWRSSNSLIPAAGFLVAVIMMGFAHGGAQLDPEITPLVPVLKSYWLIIHVAIITSSYGFFALSMIISVITLFFYSIANSRMFEKHYKKSIKEITIVSEMSLTVGLFALVVGNFLGGVWANESWGRYWSWDPKETWALISIIVYAFVLHMRLVPGLRGNYAYHVATMFAFCSMVMTYFGVNYYLSGLHTYASGDPLPVPLWVYLGLLFMLSLSIFGYLKYRKFMNEYRKIIV